MKRIKKNRTEFIFAMQILALTATSLIITLFI